MGYTFTPPTCPMAIHLPWFISFSMTVGCGFLDPPILQHRIPKVDIFAISKYSKSHLPQKVFCLELDLKNMNRARTQVIKENDSFSISSEQGFVVAYSLSVKRESCRNMAQPSNLSCCLQ